MSSYHFSILYFISFPLQIHLISFHTPIVFTYHTPLFIFMVAGIHFLGVYYALAAGNGTFESVGTGERVQSSTVE